MNSKRTRPAQYDEYTQTSATINMFGSTVELSLGSTVRILPDRYAFQLLDENDMMHVIVEGIRFTVCRQMLLQERDPKLSHNYFAANLRFHPNQTVFHMTEDASLLGTNIIARARMYPILFDFLRRRLEDRTAQPHVDILYGNDIKHIRALEDFFFPELCDILPPVVHRINSSESVLATPPRANGSARELYTSDMCFDPSFIRLAMEFKTVDPYHLLFHRANLDEVATAEVFAKPEHQRVMEKYGLTAEAVIGAKLHNVDSCSAVDIVRLPVVGLEYGVNRLNPHIV
jgi:hypothetical protein